MTYNLGSKDILNEQPTLLNFFNSKSPQQKMLKRLKQRFKPEFINRIDRKISFKKIGSEQSIKIIDLELSKFNKRIARTSIAVVLDSAAKVKINSMCDRRYCVRDIKRVFKAHIEPLVANIILSRKHSEYIGFTVDDNQLTLKR